MDAQLGHFATRLDDVASQTRVAVSALEQSAAQVDNVLNDAGHILRTVMTTVGAPRTWLMAGAASAASALARWRRSRRQAAEAHAAAR